MRNPTQLKSSHTPTTAVNVPSESLHGTLCQQQYPNGFLHARALLGIPYHQPHGWDIRGTKDLLHGGGSFEDWVRVVAG
ncbi:hypothetical protein [Nostoc flagelliforme]|uniref:hypothetical protein n=1 Tax=Nostoc flagelliforme TaxID=1306274 RepID=UPI0012FDF9B9|nr:hypothetical protein [Nostoc flagelliforme]